MISVERFGFGGGAKMKKVELEESETRFYRKYNCDDVDDDDDNFAIDHDIALSYIDEKLQDVLGHFKKDFEGEVSAENLGPKFGEYGSFLPSYHRSPDWQRPGTSQKYHISSSSNSLNNRQVERVQTNSLVPSSASLLPSRGLTSATVVSTHLLKDTVNDFSKRNEKMASAQFVEEPSSGYETSKNIPRDSERSLRVRIKVGSDNLSTRKNADIYSGLGLDISPSVSEDGSPIGSKVSPEPLNPPEESPTSILQIMTSFPVHRSLMLSPLPNDLIFLSEKQKVQVESNTKSSQQVSNANHSGRVKGRKHKSKRKKEFPIELKDHVNKDSQNATGLLLKKEKNVVSLIDEGLVEDSGIGNKVKIEFSSDLVKREKCDIGAINFPTGRSGMGFEEEKVNSSNNLLVHPKKDSYLEREEASTSLQEDCSTSVSKKKPKESRSQVAKESSNLDGSLVLMGRKREHAITVISKSEVEDSKPLKDLGKVRDTYKDFFGDMELEQDDNDVDSEEKNSNDKPEDFRKVEKSASKITSKESSNGKKREKPSITNENSKDAPTEAAAIGSGLISEASVPLVQEDWVCCDKCQKWRLLPLGTNPDNLPENWLCSMLDWLPGMNRCSFSEEETNTLVASHQLPANGPHGSSSVHASIFDQKKANEVKSVSTLANQDGPVSKSVKAPIVKSSSFKGVNQSPLVNEIANQCLSKSSALEKHRHKQKENKKLYEQHSGEIKRKREAEPGHPRVSKKAKVNDGLPLAASGKNLQKDDDHLRRDRKRDKDRKSKDSSINSHGQNSERERKKCGSTLLHRSDLPEAASENDDRKKKKARISKSVVGKESSRSKSSDVSKKLRSVNDQQIEPVLGVESLKRDLGSVQHYQATSSSSKVSGSNKYKTTISKEVKGSPVDSVSSSPSRFLNQDKSVSMKSIVGKDDFGYVALVTTGCPKRRSDGEDERGSGIPVVEQGILIGKDEAKHIADAGTKDSKLKCRVKNILDENVDDSHELPLSGRGQCKTGKSPLHLVSRAQKEREAKSSVTTTGDDSSKAPKPTKRTEQKSGNQSSKSIHLTPNGRKIKNVEAQSPARRESSSQAGNIAVKEAKDLKHLADRLKNSGSNAESTSLYFQAALKFLHGAFLLESCTSESAKKSDMIMSMQVYSSTAKLCGFCAHEYEKCKDFAAAALAYKLMEVAYMKVIYSSNTNASKDRHELQAALQIVPHGESPSSSVSDIDNPNNPAMTDKASLVKGVDSPQVTGNNVITVRNRPNVARILNFAEDVNYAMDASKKSRNAFVAAISRLNDSEGRESIKAVKKALDFNFQDVERLLRLVQLAFDAISR